MLAVSIGKLMRKINFKKEVHKTKASKKTTTELKQYIFSLVNTQLVAHYGTNYSDRCLQACLGIARVLNHYGIKSTLLEGSVCIPRLGGHGDFGWHGFWGDHHHYWLITEFQELIDLSVHQINIHSAFKGNPLISPPPIWWSKISTMPDFLVYLPLEGFGTATDVQLENIEENQQLQIYLTSIQESLEDKPYALYDNRFQHILTGHEDLLDKIKLKDEWATGCLNHSFLNPDLPQWFEEKIEEKIKNT